MLSNTMMSRRVNELPPPSPAPVAVLLGRSSCVLSRDRDGLCVRMVGFHG